MPKVPQLQSCCCGCSLETGTKLIAWIEIVAGAGVVVFMTLLAVGVITFGDGKDAPAYKMGLAGIIMIILIYAFAIVMGFTLLIGLTKKRLSNVRVWVLIKSILIVLYLIYYVVLIVIWLVASGNPVTFEIIPLIFEIYFLLVVYSYYREQKGVSGTV